MLARCLEAIEKQTFKPHTVFIVDNASTDGTDTFIKSSKRYDRVTGEIQFKYVRLKENTGGAGGFYTGMKMAFEAQESFDAFWVMDDDGIPDHQCLAKLVPQLSHNDYIASLVLAIENHSLLAFGYEGCNDVKAEVVISQGEIVRNYACPFNGILFSRKLVARIGFPIPNLFIWGDEVNYSERAIHAGFRPITVTTAIHLHPKNRMNFANSLFGKRITIATSYWREYCMIRNAVFNNKDGRRFHGLGLVKDVLAIHLYYYLVLERDLKASACCIEAFFSGFKKEPDKGYLKWMKRRKTS